MPTDRLSRLAQAVVLSAATLMTACIDPTPPAPFAPGADAGVTDPRTSTASVTPGTGTTGSTPTGTTGSTVTGSTTTGTSGSTSTTPTSTGSTPVYETPGTVRYPVAYTVLMGAGGLLDPESPPPGANHWNCRSAVHPRPIVLVNGTFANQHDNWATLAPLLWNEGYCVYTFNYGGPPLIGTIYGTHDVAHSAGELAAFVDLVLSRTGAAEVDLIGHSQGGMMPRYYLKYLGGAAKVNQLIALAPSNRGTTLFGMTKLIDFFGLRAVVGDVLTSTVCASCNDQMQNSPLLQAVNAGGDTVPGVRYTVLATKYDEIVTPYASQFLTGIDVRNILLQDVCALDLTGHIGIVFDPIALRLVLNALDPSRARAPTCQVVPFLG